MSPAPEPAQPGSCPLVAAFLVTAAGVLYEATGVSVLARSPYANDAEAPIAVIVHARGDLSGVTWQFPAALVARAAWHMVPDVVPDAAMCELAARELANLLTGRGLATLADHGCSIEIEPPQITVACPPAISGRLCTELGPVEITFHRGERLS